MEDGDTYHDAPDRFAPATFACSSCGTKGFRTSTTFTTREPRENVCPKCRRHNDAFDDQRIPNTLLVPAREEDSGSSFYSLDDDNLSVTSEITIDSACGSRDRGSTKYPSRKFKPVLENIPTEDTADDPIRWSDRLFAAMSGSDHSRRSIFSNETEDSDDLEDQLWHHERLIQHIKNHQIPKPDGGHLSLCLPKPNPVETKKDDEEDLNDSMDPLTFKQDFHPLSSKLALLSTSDQTMNSSGGNLFERSDSSMQGSSQLREAGKVAPPLQETSSSAPKPSPEESSSLVRSMRRKDENRFSLTGLDNDQRHKRGEKDANRFSLNLGDLSSLRAAAAAAESLDTYPNELDTYPNERKSGERERNRFSRSLIVGDLPQNANGRKRGGKRGPNRFSFTLNDLSNTRSNDTGLLDLSDVEEVNNAFVWSSLDVLRMAANNSDFALEPSSEPRKSTEASQSQGTSTVEQAMDMLSSDDDSDLAAALDALHNLCELSDENKLELAKADASCNDKITRVITCSSATPRMRETACKVLRCVSTDRASASALSNPIVEGIVRALSEHAKAKDVDIFSDDEFANAAMETLANLAQDPSNHSRLITGGILPFLTEVIYCNISEETYLVVCTILANLSASCDERREIVNQGCLNSLFVSMRAMIGHRKVQKEALQALSNLSEIPDATIVIADNIETILNTFRRYGKAKFAQVGRSARLQSS